MKVAVPGAFGYARRPSNLRFLVGILLGLGAAALLFAAAFAFSLGIPMEIGERKITAWYHVKQAACDKLEHQKKIVLVGGSNVLFGISALEMQQALGRPVVNYGTHAALNLDYLLWRVSKVLHKGDGVILSLEWAHFERGIFELNQVSGPYLMGGDPAYLGRMPWKDLFAMAMATDWERISLPLRVSRPESDRIQRAYDKSRVRTRLNELGDFEQNRPQDQGPLQLKAVGDVVTNANLVLNATTDLDDPIWKLLSGFIKGCRKKGVVVWISFPSLMDAPEYRSERARAIYRKIEQNFETLGAKVLTRQEETLYPRAFFFDTIYHLRSDSRTQRTKLILSKLAGQGETVKQNP